MVDRMDRIPSPPAGWLRVVFWMLSAVAAINALAFAATTANWVPTSDNWYFLERIVYPYAHGNWQLADLLVKRGPLDHAQPLRRLLLLANYEWFDLDFRVEAVFAVVAGIASFGLLCWCMRREVRAALPWSGVACVALAAVYFSLSSPIVFTWSLLTLGFTSHFFLFLWLLAAWAALEVPSPRRMAILVLSTFVFALVADDTAMVAAIAAIVAAAVYGWGDRAGVRRAFLHALACIVGIGLYLAFYKAAAPAAIGAPAREAALHGAEGGGLFAQAGQAWQWIMVPLSSALVHRTTLRAWFGDAGGVATVALGLAGALAHAWFWKQAFAGARNRTAYMATTIMLLFYGLVAGIVIGRVSKYGSEYLWQPRYAFIYRWHLVALLMMVVAQWQRLAASRPDAPWPRRIVVAACAAVVGLQVVLGASAWRDAKYMRHASANMAAQLLAMGDAPPGRVPGKCAAQLIVCRYKDARRQRLIGFLRGQRLSVFSAEVRARNGYPED